MLYFLTPALRKLLNTPDKSKAAEMPNYFRSLKWETTYTDPLICTVHTVQIHLIFIISFKIQRDLKTKPKEQKFDHCPNTYGLHCRFWFSFNLKGEMCKCDRYLKKYFSMYMMIWVGDWVLAFHFHRNNCQPLCHTFYSHSWHFQLRVHVKV